MVLATAKVSGRGSPTASLVPPRRDSDELAFWRGIVAAMPVPVLVFEHEQLITANPAALGLLSPAFEALASNGSASEVLQAIVERWGAPEDVNADLLLETLRGSPGERLIRSRDGREFCFRSVGFQAGWVAILAEVTSGGTEHAAPPSLGLELRDLLRGRATPAAPTQQFQALAAVLRATLDSVPSAVLAVDLEANLIACNRQYLALFEVDEALMVPGQSSDVVIDRYRDRLADFGRFVALSTAITKQPDRIARDQVELRDGRIFDVWVAPLQIAGEPIGRVWNWLDVSDAVARERAAQAADRAKTEFLATMSHEIRTPMTSVLGMADLLASADLGARERDLLESIRASGRHLLAIINDILDLSRIEAGGLTLQKVSFRLDQLLAEISALLGPQAQERGLELTIDVDPAVPMALLGDPTRLKQILFNLVGNAIKFTEQGRVALRAGLLELADAGTQLRFEVEDTGIGITPEQLARLFRPFTQADGTAARRYGGTGLGLAISKRLTDLMRGTIDATSVPGQGSTFRFMLPLERGQADPTDHITEAEAPRERPLRVLLAEDTRTNQLLITHVLTRRGHRVTVAEDGEEAVTLVSREAFDIVLMDIHMPVVDGVEATRRIRQLPLPSGAVPIVALTANVMDDQRAACLAAGMQGLVHKPIVWAELFRTMGDLTRGRSAQDGRHVVA